MNGNELIKKIRALGRRRNVPVRFDARRGKVSHGSLYFGARRATIKDRKAEIGRGLLADMLRQLGISNDDL